MNIEQIIEEMRKIRKDYQPNHSKELWWSYYGLRRALQKLDPYNEELNIAVSGFPYGAGLKD